MGRYCSINYKHFKTAESLIKAVSDKDYKIALSLKGTTTSSEDLAEKINHLGLKGVSDITLIIETPYEGSNEYLTISNMEMDVWLKTTIIFEQIYRAYRIMNDHPSCHEAKSGYCNKCNCNSKHLENVKPRIREFVRLPAKTSSV